MHRLFFLLLVASVLVGCAQTSPIHLASSQKSPFEGAVYSGEITNLAKAPDGAPEYRIFHQGETGFIPLQAVRSEVEERAIRFCDRSGKGMLALREVASKPPHILGNFPRIELIFTCINRDTNAQGPQTNTSKTPTTATGTGFAISSHTTVVTAFHVIEGADSITLICGGGSESVGRLVRVDPANDLALIQASSPAPSYLELAPDNSLKLGQRVFTVGFPVPGLLGIDAKYTDGSISSLSGIQGAANLLQITVPIQPGNSGGPLLNEEGKVVGVITSTAAVQGFLRRTGTLPENINWSVRSEYLKPLLSGQQKVPLATDRSAVERAKLSACLIRAKASIAN